MKLFEIVPESTFTFTKFSVALLCTWPPSGNASRKEKIIFELKWWISWINSILLVLPVIYTAYVDYRDIVLFTKSLVFFTVCFQITIKMLICKMMQRQMQYVLDEMEDYVRNASMDEKRILLYFTKKCGKVHASLLLGALVTVLGMIMEPLVLPQPFPAEAKYPFPVNTFPMFGIIYFQHAVTGIQVVCMAAIDCQMAMMLWYIVVRLKILKERTRKITNAYEFSMCVRQHQYLLRFADEVTHIVRYISLTTVSMTTMAIIMSGIHIVGNQPMVVKVQFIFTVSVCSTLVFMNAWPSEILIKSCEDIGNAIYNSKWGGNSADRGIVLVILRSSKPVVVTITGFLPILSLNYYAKFLSKTFSFFTTVRILLAKMESSVAS
uniref:Odorant receptor n=1 Tax=Meteorus pulchricornis TaxID=51522 RepID=A0A1S5VFP2_9HYME|nr:olfactory receptor 48 [Meteorus pulchricornis]